MIPGPRVSFSFVADEGTRRRLRRRGTVAGIAAVVLTAAVFADPSWLGVAPVVLEAAAALALAVLLLALFGVVAGLSCLAQLALAVWAVGLTCTARTVTDPASRLWGVAGVAAFVLLLAVRHRARPRPGAAPPPPPHPGAVVDTTAVEHPPPDGPPGPSDQPPPP